MAPFEICLNELKKSLFTVRLSLSQPKQQSRFDRELRYQQGSCDRFLLMLFSGR